MVSVSSVAANGALLAGQHTLRYIPLGFQPRLHSNNIFLRTYVCSRDLPELSEKNMSLGLAQPWRRTPVTSYTIGLGVNSTVGPAAHLVQ